MALDLGRNLAKEAKDFLLADGQVHLERRIHRGRDLHLVGLIFAAFLGLGVERVKAGMEHDIRWPDEG